MVAESNRRWLVRDVGLEKARRFSMSASIPESYLDLFHKKAFGSLSTLMPDGSPQTNPVWVDYQNGEVWVNSAVGRLKDKNIKRDPRVSVAVIDPEIPTASWKFAARCMRLPSKARPSTSTRWPRSIWGKTSTRSRNRASSVCSIRSSPSTFTSWDSGEPSQRLALQVSGFAGSRKNFPVEDPCFSRGSWTSVQRKVIACSGGALALGCTMPGAKATIRRERFSRSTKKILPRINAGASTYSLGSTRHSYAACFSRATKNCLGLNGVASRRGGICQ